MRELGSVLLLVCLLAARLALAGPTYGFEVTLYNDALLSRKITGHEVLARIRRRLDKDFVRFCPPGACQVSQRSDAATGGLLSFRLKYDDGAIVEWTVDGRLIEVKVHGRPQLADLKRWEKNLQLGIFDLGAAADPLQEPELHLQPHAHQGGGHEHMGLYETFGGDMMLFRNFLVYHFNHPEIGIATRGRKTSNGITLADQKNAARRRRVLALIREFDALPPEQRWSFADFRDHLNAIDASYSKEMMVRWAGSKHAPDSTLEIRSGGPFRDAHEIILRASLRERILNRLREEKGPIPIEVPQRSPSPPDAIALFAATAKSLGIPAQDYLPLIHIIPGRHEAPCREAWAKLLEAAGIEKVAPAK